jgi:hypothetical protein
MDRSFRIAIAISTALLIPSLAFAQIGTPLTGYYAALGDSVAAGTGAQPDTNGYTYRLYDQGVFGRTQDTAFSSGAIRGARSWDLRDHQAPQLLCAEIPQRPTVVTITAGANDFFLGDTDVAAIALRVAEAVNLLLNNPLLPSPVRDPVTDQPCRALANVTILVSNYYSIPHPVPAVAALLDQLLQGFDQALRFWLAQVVVPAGSHLAIVDLYTPSLGRQGLVTIERRLGFPGPGPFDFDPHPTNLGHAFIAQQFEDAWRALQN